MGHKKLVTTFAFLAIVSAIVVTISQSVYDAGVISRAFELGKVLPKQIGWFIFVGLGAVFAVVISSEIEIGK